ncbi:hypothetical protein D9M71_673780 [compost metagenome]
MCGRISVIGDHRTAQMPALPPVEPYPQQTNRIQTKANGTLSKAGLVVQPEPLSPLLRFRRQAISHSVVAIVIEVSKSQAHLAVTYVISIGISCSQPPSNANQSPADKLSSTHTANLSLLFLDEPSPPMNSHQQEQE